MWRSSSPSVDEDPLEHSDMRQRRMGTSPIEKVDDGKRLEPSHVRSIKDVDTHSASGHAHLNERNATYLSEETASNSGGKAAKKTVFRVAFGFTLCAPCNYRPTVLMGRDSFGP